MTTIKTKIAANGTALYYVDGKRVSRDVAIEAATVNRNGNPFDDFSLISAPEADVGDYAVTVEAQDAAIDAEIENANNSTDEIVNVENLTANQRLAAQIVAKLGNLIVKCNTGEYGTRSGKTIHYETYADENDEFGTTLSIVEVFTDEENFILDHVNLIKGYGDDKTVETFYFTKPEVESVNVEDYAVTIEAQDVATEAEIELATVNTESSSKESAPADDFETKLAELQADVDAARIDYDAKTAERMKLQAAVEDAKNAEYIAYDNLCVATRKFDRLGNAKARELCDNLITSEILATRDLIIYNQKGRDYLPVLKFLGVWFIDGKFEIRCDKEASNIIYTLAEYDTPAQVTAAINQLKDAIERGEKEFKFPTINGLDTQNAMDVFKKIYRFGRLRHVVASNGQHMWHSYGRRISAMERDSILKEYGITVDAFLAAEKQFQIEEDARLDAALKAHDQARFLWDKIQRESKPLDDDNVADLLPSVDELNDVQDDEPPEYKPQCTWENPHTIVMKTALLRCQIACQVLDIPAALNELKLFATYRDANKVELEEEPAPTPKRARQIDNNKTIASNLKKAAKRRVSFINRLNDAIKSVEDDCAFNQVCYDEPDDSRERVHFDAELKQLIAKGLKLIRRRDAIVKHLNQLTSWLAEYNPKSGKADYEKTEAEAVKYDDAVKDLDKQIETVEDECAFNQVCYDEPDDSRERVHFDAELKQLIAKGLRLIQKRDKLATHRDRLYLTIERLDAQVI